MLEQNGIMSAAILNDQGTELVDTRWVQSRGIQADQVVGGCFCCLFSDLIDAAERLRAHAPEVIFTEAVGSCTDISATTLQPLKLYYKDRFRVAPYTVLADPARAQELTNGNPEFAFLFNKQLEEADLVCFTKSDLYINLPKLQAASVRHLSSVSGDGVKAWLAEVLAGTLQTGMKILEIDYQRYAQAEAGLAWLNCSASLALDSPLTPSAVVGPLLEALDNSLTVENLQIAHMKVSDDTSTGFLKASVTRNGDAPTLQGDLQASQATLHELLLNIRAAGKPAHLQFLVEQNLSKLPGSVQIKAMQCFKPSAPKPEYRLSGVITNE
jgi:hypothetical protein